MIEWINKDKYVILGFSRCGTTALSHYLKCGHPEIGYNGTEEYLKNYSQCTPVFLTRHPVDRIWSMYNYHNYFMNYTFEDFLNFKNPLWHGVGMNDCIEQSDYDKYIEPFKEFGALVYRLEDMIRMPDYPKDHRGQSSKKIPKKYRDMVEDKLREANIKY